MRSLWQRQQRTQPAAVAVAIDERPLLPAQQGCRARCCGAPECTTVFFRLSAPFEEVERRGGACPVGGARA